MASLSIRKLDPQIYQRLRMQAAKHGISMEEEVRQILFQALSAPEKMSAVFLKYFGSNNGVDLDTLSQRKAHQPMDFSE
jgi:plasmid stability protein